MDGDAYRRHRPTAWAVFGVPQAILAGDALLTLAWQVLEERDTDLLPQLSSSLMALLEGQSSDVAFEERTRVSLDECRSMAAGKTGALIAAACAFGAAAGTAPPDQVASARRYGHHIGLAFQLVDDLLGIWGDPAVTGKPVHADLAARKKSLPVVAALASSTAEADELAAMYERPDAWDGTALARAARLVDIAGGRRWCEERATEHVRSATDCLDALGLTGNHRADLLSLAALVVRRDR
jgi:geranylgeranyl diphosphate synthase type I